jgi:hypothetical protein
MLVGCVVYAVQPNRCCKLLPAPVCVQRIYDAILVLVPEVAVLLQNCSVGQVVAA